jgi:EAL domain-containing protein (putative c-di-GMP-specific phosphodiesterase class I)
MAEEGGLIIELDRWVLERACRDGAEFRASGVLAPEALLAVNISAHNAGNPDLIDIVRKAAADAQFPLTSLELEVTETAVMAEVPEIRRVLTDVRQLGMGIALDDFGTGYSSLTFVRQLPVTSIKIDLSFTKHIADRHDDRAITASVIDLARAVGLRTIAEGVETAEQLSVLHRLGCHAGQGYLWSKALSPEELTSLVQRKKEGFLSAASSPLPRPLSRPGAGLLGKRRGAE